MILLSLPLCCCHCSAANLESSPAAMSSGGLGSKQTYLQVIIIIPHKYRSIYQRPKRLGWWLTIALRWRGMVRNPGQSTLGIKNAVLANINLWITSNWPQGKKNAARCVGLFPRHCGTIKNRLNPDAKLNLHFLTTSALSVTIHLSWRDLGFYPEHNRPLGLQKQVPNWMQTSCPIVRKKGNLLSMFNKKKTNIFCLAFKGCVLFSSRNLILL